MKYFQHRFIIWSTRKRGRVQRIQMITKMRATILVEEDAEAEELQPADALLLLGGDEAGCASRRGTAAWRRRRCTNRFTHSTSEKSEKRKPEYSVL